MASSTLSGPGSIDAVAHMLADRMQQSAMSLQLIDQVSRNFDSARMTVMVFEKYFMRASNRASLTVVLSEQGGTVSADLISSGGGQGALFRFSWGAEESFVGTAENILREAGLR